MALSLLAANNAQTVLAAGISSTATSLTVNTGTGTLFPSPVTGTSFFKLTIIDAATGSLTEIVHVTARNGDVFTIQRGQEGTVARAWSANDIAANMMTAGTLSYILGNFQPLDPTLTALAALVGVANKLPYFNGNDTAALTDLTQVGRDIIGKSTIADILTYLGLSSFADKAAETKQTFSYTVQAKYGYEVLSAAGEIVAALYADNRSAYLHSVSGKPVTIPDKAGTMALVDDLKAGLPPIGIPFFWPQAAMPNTVVDEWSQMVFLKMNDTTFSATQYPILAKVWPGLKLTDSRGEFIRINDDGRGIDAGRALLSAQGDAIRNITGGLGFVPMVGNVDVYGAFTVGGSQNIVNLGVDGNPTTIAQSMYFEAAKSGVPVAAENRPRNITFNLVVRAK
ncbi:hypothetical protein [Citrobacter sp. CRE-46]|uniref:hypothetical protein n=1 Tax=Citrobacter sp. CRE-46 TaxID=1703250 RepID=UPI0026A26FBA